MRTKSFFFATALILSWPATDALAQKIKSADYTATNGSDYYSDQPKGSSTYTGLQNKQDMNTIRQHANVESSAIVRQIEKKYEEAERAAAQKEQDNKKNSGSDQKEDTANESNKK